MDADLLRRYRFHREHNGGWVGHDAEVALRAARVEILLDEAIDLGLAEVAWEWDDEPYDCGDDDPEWVARQFESNAWTGPFGCVLTLNGEVLTSVWGVVVGPRGTDDPYCRVTVSDLALEIEDDLRQAIGDHLDAEQPSLL